MKEPTDEQAKEQICGNCEYWEVIPDTDGVVGFCWGEMELNDVMTVRGWGRDCDYFEVIHERST